LRNLGISVSNSAEPQYLATIITECAASAPQPWYPSEYVQQTGTPRETLDPYLDRLRMGGLIQLTDWVEGKGQGYVLTPAGSEVLANQRQFARLRAGEVRAPAGTPRPIADPGTMVPVGWERAEAVRTAFLGHTTPVVTFGLIAVNVLWFVYGLALATREGILAQNYLFNIDIGVNQILHRIGSLRGSDIYVNHEWWRLLTCCFVHVGFFHLAVNMYSLFVVGPLLERLWGRIGFLVLYLIAGLGGSCGVLIENPLVAGAGASGAIWGVLASLATWLFLNRTVLPPQLISSMRRQLITIFLLNILITFGVPQISKGAHFGGGVVGLLTAVPLDILRFGKGKQWWGGLAALIAIPTLCLAAAIVSLNRSGQSMAESEERRAALEQLTEDRRETVKLLKEIRTIFEDGGASLLEKAATDRPRPQSERVAAEFERERARLIALQARLDRGADPGDGDGNQTKREMSRFIAQVIRLLDRAEKRLKRNEEWTPNDGKLLKWFMDEMKSLP
jgi:rhomboid protease GluP